MPEKKTKVKNSTIKKVVQLLIVVLLICVGIYLSAEPLYTPTAIINSKNHSRFAQLIAHKSLVDNEYEANTIEAIQSALASTVDGIEIDVRLSKDNIAFIYHGDTLEEATDGKGCPEDYTWDQLKKISYLDVNKSKLISLVEVLEQVGSQKFLFLDIKSSQIINNNFISTIVDLIYKYHLQETVIVESFNPVFLAAMRLKARDILLMYDFTTDSVAGKGEVQTQFDKIPWLLKQPFIQKQIRRIVRPDILGPRWNINETILKPLIAGGYPIICWTVDDIVIAKHLFSLGVSGVQTNNFMALMELLPRNSLVYDAGGTISKIEEVINVHSSEDIINVIRRAKSNKLSITIAGRRHSMGGQTLLDGSLHVDMMKMSQVSYNPINHNVRAGAGATWKKIQQTLNAHGRAVQIMQSDNIFTAGGSVSVNVHGWQVGSPPISSTIHSIKIITADSKILNISPTNEPELFKAVIGGYGQLGIITEIEFSTVPNSLLKFHAEFIEPKDFAMKFQEKVTNNPKAELAYGRLSLDHNNNMFKEAGLFWYESTGEYNSSNILPESLIALKRTIFRGSQYINLGKRIRWTAEKIYAQKLMSMPAISRNTIMSSDTHILWPLYGQSHDILHEYFVPKHEIVNFLALLKKLVLEEDVNLLNVTIREIKQDTLTMLPYAKEDVFGFVLLFSQTPGEREEKKMELFSLKMIDGIIKLGGTFYLPYRLHYSKFQFNECYPGFQKWLEIKVKWDPNNIFNSKFFQHIQP